MIATFYDKLFAYADKVKGKYGKESKEYKIAKEIEDILQGAYDENNQFDGNTLDKKPTNDIEAYVFDRLPEVKVFHDNDGYYYEIDGHHKDTPSEVLDYVLKDRDNAYRNMALVYEKACSKAVSRFKKKLEDTLLKEFEESLLKTEGEADNDAEKWRISELQKRAVKLNELEASLNIREEALNRKEEALNKREEKLKAMESEDE